MRLSTQRHGCFICGGSRPLSDFTTRRYHDYSLTHSIVDLSVLACQELLAPLLKTDQLSLDAPASTSSYMLFPELVARSIAEPAYPCRCCNRCFNSLSANSIPIFCYATYPLTLTPPQLLGLSTFEAHEIAYVLPVPHLVLPYPAWRRQQCQTYNRNVYNHIPIVLYRTSARRKWRQDLLPYQPQQIRLAAVV